MPSNAIPTGAAIPAAQGPNAQTPARPFVVRAFALVHPYWSRSSDRGVAWLLLISILGLTLGLVYLNVEYNFWNRNFFNALESKDHQAFWLLIPTFFALSVLTIVGTALQAYLTQMLQMRWRIWLTREYLAAWFADRHFYHLELDPRGTDNPDQRMTEDLRQLTTSTLDLSLGFLHNLVTLVSFIAILWNVSHAVSLAILGTSWSVPGDMVWAALLYAVLGSAATYYVGRPLIGLRFQQERFEADMRFSLMRTREHAEGVALYRGEAAEQTHVDQRIAGLQSNWRQIMLATLKLNGLSGVYTQIGILFPYALASPRYFTGQLTLGGLTQIAGAFDTVRTALSWFVFNYQALAIWKASVDRLLTFEAAIARIGADQLSASGIRRDTTASSEVVTADLVLGTPSGERVLVPGDLRIERGDHLLLRGAPGVGKTTLFRALAGLWPFGSGRISVPGEGSMLFLPQKPYMPIGTLAAAVCYPAVAGAFRNAEIEAALAAVGLGSLIARLPESANWPQILSGGEQQKLAVARILLHRPDWLFLDEATSALDERSEADIYALLMSRLPSSAIVSIAHRPHLTRFHDRVMELSAATVGAR